MSKDRIIIYRVEHKLDGSGPYAGKRSISAKFPEMHNDPQHPSPYLETEYDSKPIHMYGDKRCAFRNIAQLKRWFSVEDRRILDKHSFHIAEYSIPSTYLVAHLPMQTVFKKNVGCRILRTMSPLEV